MGAGGRWVGTRPFPGSCLSMGPALLGLYKSCGHTQWGAMDAPFPCFVLLHLLDHLFLRRPLAPCLFFLLAPSSSCSPSFRPPGMSLQGSPLARYPLFFLPHVPSTAGLTGLCACLPQRALLASLPLTVYSQHLERQGSSNLGLPWP